MTISIMTPAGASAMQRPPDNLATPIHEAQGVEIEYYAPPGEDVQTPHDRDELYFIAKGSATFTGRGTAKKVTAGDMIFVAAREEHRFEEIEEGFATWVVFFGDKR